MVKPEYAYVSSYDQVVWDRVQVDQVAKSLTATRFSVREMSTREYLSLLGNLSHVLEVMVFTVISWITDMGNSTQSPWNFQLLQNFCQGQNSDSNSTFWSCHYLKFSADRLILMSVYNLAEV